MNYYGIFDEAQTLVNNLNENYKRYHNPPIPSIFIILIIVALGFYFGDTPERKNILEPMYIVCILVYLSGFVISTVLIRYKNESIIEEFNQVMKHNGIWAQISYIYGYHHHGTERRSYQRTILSVDYKTI